MTYNVFDSIGNAISQSVLYDYISEGSTLYVGMLRGTSFPYTLVQEQNPKMAENAEEWPRELNIERSYCRLTYSKRTYPLARKQALNSSLFVYFKANFFFAHCN